MSMTLSQMLALLADNTSGEISAADMRAIVTDLHAMASAVRHVNSFKWLDVEEPVTTNSEVVAVDSWSAPTTMYVSYTDADGNGWRWTRDLQGKSLLLQAPDGSSKITATLGAYSAFELAPGYTFATYPLTGVAVTGSEPAAGDFVDVWMIEEAPPA